jgi:hypothetical protein
MVYEFKARLKIYQKEDGGEFKESDPSPQRGVCRSPEKTIGS